MNHHPTDRSSLVRTSLLVGFCLIGVGIGVYLSLFQLGFLTSVWDPIFHTGSEEVLDSTISKSLPFPDALLGVVVYTFEIGLLIYDETHSFSLESRSGFWTAILTYGMAFASLGLIAVQAFFIHNFCFLCLMSAAVSFVNAGLLWGRIKFELLRWIQNKFS